MVFRCEMLQQTENLFVLTMFLFREDSLRDEVQNASLHKVKLVDLSWISYEAESLLDHREVSVFQ